MVLGWGANKGLVGIGITPIGPSSIATRKAMRHLAELKGLKIRVLASPFQLEMIKRMDASPVAMTLADVLPGLQQGAIDAALATITVYSTMQYQDAAKYVIESDQPYLNSIIVMSKKWLDSLPPDLQKIVRDDAEQVSVDLVPFVKEFFAKQRKVWTDKGRRVDQLPGCGAVRADREDIQHRRGPVEEQAGAQQRRQGSLRIGKAQQVATHSA